MLVLILILFIVCLVFSVYLFYLLKQLDDDIDELYNIFYSNFEIEIKKNGKSKVVNL